MEIKLKSPVFKEGDMIPKKYTCDGEDISPPLSWEMLPEGTQSLALICDDPDAPLGAWVHWVIFDIPSYIAELPEGIPPKKILENGIKQGKNDFGKIGYGGPCPPGGIHRYYFKLYALNKKLILEPGITKDDLLEAMKECMLAQGQLMGRYKR